MLLFHQPFYIDYYAKGYYAKGFQFLLDHVQSYFLPVLLAIMLTTIMVIRQPRAILVIIRIFALQRYIHLHRFKTKILKMGDIRIIWIPMALREMIKDFNKGDILVSIKKAKSEKK